MKSAKLSQKIFQEKRGIKVAFITCSIIFALIFYFKIIKDLPNADDLSSYENPVSTKIYDRNGTLLYQIYKDENRTPVKIDSLPKYVPLSVMAAEDSDFLNHHGVSIKGILRAFFEDIKYGKLTGGSTITQQLVKNILLTPEKTLTRKLKEMVLALEVEKKFKKQEILEKYLNKIGFGGSVYGIEEASLTYFGKNAKDLNIAQSALLAGLIQNPSTLSPFTNPNQALARKNQVLSLMLKNNFINQKEYSEALNQNITFAKNKTEIKAPHFVMYVKDQLIKKYGEEKVENGGLIVQTTLDLNIQNLAQIEVQKEIDKVRGLNVTNGGTVILDPKTGQILAMVGSYDYFDSKNDGQVNVTISLRQPGSSIKVVNYAYALSHGFTPATLIADTPVSFLTAGSPPYIPVNYDQKFRGIISLRSALAESRNIPAVKVLASYGVQNMMEEGRKMGITSWIDPSNYGLSLTLGGGEVRLVDLALVYSTIANYGIKPDLTSILSIKDYKGQILEKEDCCETKNTVLDPRVAFMLIDILKDNHARTPAFGAHSELVIDNHPNIAVKTGTSNDLRDNLTIGFNQNYVIAVWVGNNNNSKMSRIASGVTGASSIWNRIMTKLVSGKPDLAWPIPSGLTQTAICAQTLTLPCGNCPTKIEWFKNESLPHSCDIKNLAHEKEPDKLLSFQKVNLF